MKGRELRARQVMEVESTGYVQMQVSVVHKIKPVRFV